MNSEIANSIFRYDEFTGRLFWKVRPCKNIAAGSEIKTMLANGYLAVRHQGKRYLVHRVVWLMKNGRWPDGQIDHLNHNRKDNRIENLRDVSASENQRNKSLHKNNSSGETGVSFHKRSSKWRVTYQGMNGKHVHVGLFGSFDEAVTAKAKAISEGGFHRNHGR